MAFQHELILPNQDLPFKMFLFEGKEGKYIREKHWHCAVELFVVLNGSLRFFIADREYLLKQKEGILINSNEVHSILASSPNTTVVIQIPMKAFQNYVTDENYIGFENNTGIQDSHLMELIAKMYEIYEEKKVGYELQVKSLYYELLYCLITCYRKEEVSSEEIKRNKKLNKLTTITNYIKEHYEQELALEQVAKMFGYSPTYLSHMFQTYAHCKYKQYVQGVRMEHAYLVMHNTDLTIHEIALKHGFANQKAFAKEFQRKYHILPSEYRKSFHKHEGEERIPHALVKEMEAEFPAH